MLSKEWLFEAQKNIQVKKNLNLLSDEDIETILHKLSISEARSKYVSIKRKDSEPVEYPAQAPQTVKSPKARVKKPPTDLDGIVKNLSQKDKAALAATLQKEKEERAKQRKIKRLQSKPLQTKTIVEPKKSSGMLGKIVLGLLVGIGAASFFSDDPAQSSSTLQTEPKLDTAEQRAAKFLADSPYSVSRFVKQNAFDEDSLKFRNWQYHIIPLGGDTNSGEAHLVTTGEYNGKNRLGAYVGYKSFVASIDPDTGEVQKFYTEDDPKYISALALTRQPEVISKPLPGPN